MPERIRKASLAMSSPRDVVIGGRLHVGCAGASGLIDESTWLIDEDFDPRGRQPDVGRTGLSLSAWYGLVQKERGAVEMKASDSA
ncbi:MAG: hypothetical protein QOJ25_1755 [Solirubrobacteraceae bacterium]|nr:hypothetical protein [Solirubrobacteraceae bacterium]